MALWRATWEQGVRLCIWCSQPQMLCLTPRWYPINGCWMKKWLQFGGGRINLNIVVVQSLSHVRLLATPWTAAHQASLIFTTSRSLLRLMSTESGMPSNHLFLCRPFSFSFNLHRLFTSGGQSTGASASASGLLIKGWFLLGLTGLIPLQSKDSQESSPASILRLSVFFMDIQNTDNSGGLFLKIQPEN